jgi:hypothetical protein
MIRNLAALAALVIALLAGLATIPAQARTHPNDCCSIPTSETARPVSPTSTYGIPAGETLRPCRPTIGHPCP